MSEAELERLREQVTATIRRGTALLADLHALDDGLVPLMPEIGRMAESERQAFVARLCGYDASLPDRLHELIDGLADLVAGLTATDGGQAWVRHHLTRLEAGEESEAA
ncbi:MAG TPA: hypothetical protein VGT02_11300 [Methylomirabilota bacterium]|nr:hypothetical protein [Methylomirabilota bacterium]